MNGAKHGPPTRSSGHWSQASRPIAQQELTSAGSDGNLIQAVDRNGSNRSQGGTTSGRSACWTQGNRVTYEQLAIAAVVHPDDDVVVAQYVDIENRAQGASSAAGLASRAASAATPFSPYPANVCSAPAMSPRPRCLPATRTHGPSYSG